MLLPCQSISCPCFKTVEGRDGEDEEDGEDEGYGEDEEDGEDGGYGEDGKSFESCRGGFYH